MSSAAQVAWGQELLNDILADAQHVQPDPYARSVDFVDAADFLVSDFRAQWLINGVLVAGQPAVIGGPKKGMKSTIVCDAAISMALGLPFLGRFTVPSPIRVGVLNGESGPATIQETIRRICIAKDVSPNDLGGRLSLGTTLPRLNDPGDLPMLGDAIRRHRHQVIIIDPLYLALLSGDTSRQATNLYDMGPLFAAVAHICLREGATPIFVHHHTQTAAKSHSPPGLEGLAFAGIQEFARQWLLIGRRAQFEPGSGQHNLWLSVGGSAGHSNCWAVDINEGQLNLDFTGRTWEVAVRPAQEARTSGRDAMSHRRSDLRQGRAETDRQTVLATLGGFPQGETLSAIRTAAGLSGSRARIALESLVASGHAISVTVEKRAGNAGSRTYPGFQLSLPGQAGAVGAQAPEASA